MNFSTMRRRGLASCSTAALLAAAGVLGFAGVAAAQTQSAAPNTGGEGVEVTGVVITAERSKAAATAPTKASVDETQPEAIISRKFIEQVTPEDGGWVSAAAIAPSVSGITSNGGGVGETGKLTMRGFQDGQFNLTYDGIAFGDTNGPTHHQASYWPSSTIGAIVIDRGPGAAGDLGPANFGGAIHLFSPTLTDTFSASQKLTYGSFNTVSAVTTLNTGLLPQTGARALLSFDERQSDGELTHSYGQAQNQLAKVELPMGSKWTLTLFGSHNYTRFYQNDGFGPGATYAQVLDFGKDYALNNTPGSEHYYKYNQQSKQTDFEYADVKGELAPSITLEDQLYSYFYTNKTISTNSTADVGNSNASSLISASGKALLPGEATSDLGGYDKLNQYRVSGDVVRLNKDFSFGTLKVGGLYEWSTTDRHNLLEDITDGWAPDNKFVPSAKLPLLTATTNAKLQENSDWQDYQLFADFYWRPINGLTITPGFKYVSEHLQVRAADENTAGGSKNQPLFDTATDSAPLYFLTANYKITPNWAIYGQFATSFVFPDITSLYFTGAGAGLQSIKPEQTKTYQAGTVYSRGNFTADADVYRVDATNLLQSCATPAGAEDCNVGSARFTGVEGEAAYAFDFGLTLFANGGSNVAKQLANAANSTLGIAANPAQELGAAPRWTYAYGAIYTLGPWQGSLTYKNSGAYAEYSAASGGPPITRYQLPGYDTIDASAAYDFGRFKVKLQGFNLADKRAITSFLAPTGASKLFNPDPADQAVYLFQAGREIDLTLQAKF
jgi:iron complex outermembrane recepter protein